MKTERITILGSPQFKSFLSTQARRHKMSVGEFVRSRCENRPSAEDAELEMLTEALRQSVAEAKRSLRDGLREARTVLAELQQKRKTRMAGAA